MNFRCYHIIMAYVSICYFAILIMPYAVLLLGMMCFDRLLFSPPHATINTLLWVSLGSSIVLNLLLFSVRYYVRRDCLSALLCALVVLLCTIAEYTIVPYFYSGQATRPVLITDDIIVLHGIVFLLFNLYYNHVDKRNSAKP